VQQKDEYGKPKEKGQRTSKYVYDPQGREKEHDVLDGKGELVVRYKVQYREDGEVKERVIYSKDGRVSVRMEYAYDSQKRLIATTTYNPDDKIIKKVTSEFDSQGNKIKEEVKEFVGKYGTDIVYYWAYINGRKARETKTTLNNEKERRYSSEFDEWGNIIKQVEPSGTVINTVYTFDQYKNWVTATSSWKGSDGMVRYKKVREIQYY